MSSPDRRLAEAMVEELEGCVARPECLTCDCFQGMLTQLELDCDEDITDVAGRLKMPKEKMHGCLGCDPCPGGVLYARYLKSRIPYW